MRARCIKPGFWKNEDLSECSAYARLLYIGLWGLCDWEGRTEFRAKRIKAELFPYNDGIDLAGCFLELQKYGFVTFYENAKYIYIPNFTRHQNPHKNERKSPSKLPKPTSETMCTVSRPSKDGTKTEQERNRSCCLLIVDRCSLDSGIESAAPQPEEVASPKTEPEPDPTLQRIVDAYNSVAARQKAWPKKGGVPKSSTDLGRVLRLRASEQDFVDNLERYSEIMASLDWAEGKDMKFFLYRNSFDECMSGAWEPRSKGRFQKVTLAKEEDPPWIAAEKRNAAIAAANYCPPTPEGGFM